MNRHDTAFSLDKFYCFASIVAEYRKVVEGATVHWNGFQPGQFQQTFTLPTSINSERAEANYTDGVLTLNLPKAEHVKARTVKVTAKK